eukprot:IDg8003t1
MLLGGVSLGAARGQPVAHLPAARTKRGTSSVPYPVRIRANAFITMEPSADKEKKLGVAKTIQKKARTSPKTEVAESEVLKDAAATKLASTLKKGATDPASDSVEKVRADLVETDKDKDGKSPTAADSKEYDVKHPTGDKMRNKVRELLMKALQTDKPGAKEAEMVAAAIEEAMFKKFEGNGAPYKTKYRALSFNLKDAKNDKLRETVLARELLPSVLVDMSSKQLANEELKKTREKVQEKMTRDAMPYNKPAASTSEFKCGKCKQRKCTYFQMQTRSADEPLTTFVHCVNCDNRWRF